jgi:hypothetical protein
MPVFGLVVAGSYDEAVLSRMVKRIRSDVVGVVPRLCRSDRQVTTKFCSFLKELRHANIDKAIVVRDSHAGSAEQVLAKLRVGFREQDHPFPVRFAVVDPEPEAWLLADHNALTQLARERDCPTNFTPLNSPPEQLLDPKAELKSRLAMARVPYTREAAARLAELCDLDRVTALCPSFTSFKRAVVDC